MHIFLLVLAILLSGCKETVDDAEVNLQKPEDVATAFFYAVYNDRDISATKPYVNEEIWQILTHYKIATAVQRHVLNLTMTDITVQVLDVDLDFFRKFTSSTEVIVKIIGTKRGRKWKDDRKLLLKKKGKRWIITKIKTNKLR